MDVDDLKSLYLRELQELCAFEAEMAGALPRMAMSAGSVELRRAIGRLAEQAALHEQRAEAILRRHGSGRQADADQVAIALVEKAGRIMCGVADPDLRDAALIASVRRIEHHQIAAYSAADGYAEALFLELDRHGLLAALQEKKIADRRLEGLQGDINRLALLVSTPPY